MSRTDDQLLTALMKGDDDAFIELVERYQTMLFNFFVRLCRNRTIAEDLAQDVFLKTFTSAKKLDKPIAFSQLLFRIAKMHWYSYLRKLYRTPKVHGRIDEFEELIEKPGTQEADDTIEMTSALESMYSALELLSPEQRLIVDLSYFMDIPYKEIAEILEIPIGTVKSRLNSAVNRMRGIIERDTN